MKKADNPTGWADRRLMGAYDLVYEVSQDHTDMESPPEFGALLGMIERVDEQLVQCLAIAEEEAAEEAAANGQFGVGA